jgi:DhnA family fructose-bisphosphate aldolase class Ia
VKNPFRSEQVNSLDYRLKEFLQGTDHRAVLLDASAGLSLGVLPGLEYFNSALQPLLYSLDGLVCSPGQMRRMANRTRSDATLLVRMDWTNTLRDVSFVLPPESVEHISILTAVDALELGATAMVMSFLLGYDEVIEADCLKSTVQLALTGKELGMPLVVEVLPSGPRVSLPGKAAELGASYALEGGADVVIVPYPGMDSLKTIGNMLSIPWLLKPGSAATFESEWDQASGLGASGVWLDHTWLKNFSNLEKIIGTVHKSRVTGG